MSFTLVAKAMGLKIGNTTKKMVLIKLADQSNDDGACWPSYQTIADACEVHRRTVMRHIKALEKDGYLNVHRSYDESNKKNYSNKYILTLDKGDNLSLVTEDTASGDTVSLGGDNASLSGDTVSPKPIIEPTKEPIKESNRNSKSKKPKFNPFKHPIPDFINSEIWKSYIQTRIDIKKPFTENTMSLLLNRLKKWYDAGLDVNTSIENSAISNYPSVYEPKNKRIQTQGQTHANNQSANQAPTSQRKKSKADLYAEQLAYDLAEHQARNSELN